jgi:hypothetical protein
MGGGEDAVDACKREELLAPLRRDDLEGHPDLGRDAADPFELVQAVTRAGEPDGTRLVEARRLTRLVPERAVELDARAQEGHQVVARRVLRQEAGRMPCRAARELVGLEQNGIRGAEPRQVVEDARAGDAAPDDGHPRLGHHGRESVAELTLVRQGGWCGVSQRFTKNGRSGTPHFPTAPRPDWLSFWEYMRRSRIGAGGAAPARAKGQPAAQRP